MTTGTPSSDVKNLGKDPSRAIYDVVQSFIGLISPDGVLLDANRSSLDFIGMELPDVANKPFCETPWWRGCKVSREALEDAIRRGASGEFSRFEARLTSADGNITEVDFSLTPIVGECGTVAFLVPEARDITEIKNAANALHETEARLRLACDAAEIGTWDWDLTTDKVHWNKQHFELFGMSKLSDEMTIEAAIANLHPEDLDRAIETATHSIKYKVPYRDEFRIVQDNGNIRWIVSQGKPLHFNAKGRPQSMIGVTYDITERKNAVLELTKINKELEERVAERTRDLEQEMRERQKAQEALSHAQRLEAIGQLAGGIAHDFNNLLAVIGGNLELALLNLPDDPAAELIQDSLKAVEAGANLNQRLLSFAQKRSLAPVGLNVNDRIADAVIIYQRALNENISLELELSPDIREAFVDPGEFDSALLNLVINARDAMPSGGKLRISTCNLKFGRGDRKTHPSAHPGDYILLSVSDTGTGMTQEVQEKAMTPFFTTKEPGKGSGLGLSSVFGFAGQSGGFVTIESEDGAGSTINIYLPQAHSGAHASLSDAQAGDTPLGNGEVVLVVEDDDAVLRVTRKRLIALGYNVIEAKTAAEAIKLLEKGDPLSLVFSDVRMPGELSGYDLAEWLSQNRPDIQVLLTSGYNEYAVGEEQHIRLLAKPYSLKVLAHALDDALARN